MNHKENRERLLNPQATVLIAGLAALIGGCRTETEIKIDSAISEINQTVDDLTQNCEKAISNQKNYKNEGSSSRVIAEDDSLCECYNSETTNECRFSEPKNSSGANNYSIVEVNRDNQDERIRFSRAKGKKWNSSVLAVDNERCYEVPYFESIRTLNMPSNECRAYIKSVRDRLRQLSGHFEKRSGK